MGAKQSSHNGRANARNVANGGAMATAGLPESSRVVALDPRVRARSLNNVGQSLSIPGHSASLQESDLSSSPEDNSPSPRGIALQGAHSLPSHLFATYTSFLNGKINYIYISHGNCYSFLENKTRSGFSKPLLALIFNLFTFVFPFHDESAPAWLFSQE